MGALGRVELPTNGLGNRCSIHLSYRAISVRSLSHGLNGELRRSSTYAWSKATRISVATVDTARCTSADKSRVSSKLEASIP